MRLGSGLSVIDLSSRRSVPPVSGSPALSLSLQLRGETADLHHEVEQKLGLPGTITSLPEYKLLLQRFYRLYRPLELHLANLSGWREIGIDPSGFMHSVNLAADLRALGISPLDLVDAPESSQPTLVNFAHALGVMYVIEGSSLGSQVILPQLVTVLGTQIEHADSFFQGRGAQTGAAWSAFRISLDRYGVQHRNKKGDVVNGAKSAFSAIGAWMQS